MIIVMAGLPGTGKSTLGRELSLRLSATVLSKDEIRHALFEPRDVEYSTEQDDFCMEVMLQTAAYVLRKYPDRIVILDGRTFSRRYQVERVVEVATQLSQAWHIFECVCREETARDRLARPQGHVATNRDFELYRRVSDHRQEITFPKTVIDTDETVELCVQRALAVLA